MDPYSQLMWIGPATNEIVAGLEQPMTLQNTDEHVLPRPVECLPDYAHGKARQALADKIVDAFALSPASASAIAAAVVDPAEVRKLIHEPADPDVERIPVPGGTLLGIRTTVWSRRIMPDPRNPRTLPQRRHPFAVDPGAGDEASKFRPLPDPRPVFPEQPQQPELAVEVENREHLTWASQLAGRYVLADNDWRDSISTQGVMEAVWLVATTFFHSDGSEPATSLVTVEGSSRCTSVHDLLQVRSADVPYEDEMKIRKRIRELNEAFVREPTSRISVSLRCERMPALILVGFRPHAGGNTGFSTAVKSMVALRHVDPPKPWGDGPENESLADEVLDELYRRNLISANEKAYYAGSLTRAEAVAAHLPADPVLRAAKIVRLFTTTDSDVKNAIRVAFTSQSTRKYITPKRKDDLATALVLRAVIDDPAKIDQTRRYLRYAFGKSVHRFNWSSTGRTPEHLTNDALREVELWLADSAKAEDPGPASLELAVRAAYPLIVTGRLNADRGTANNNQPDRRTPGELLDTMRRSVQGVHQLGHALRDYAQEIAIRAVDESGSVKQLDDGSGPQTVHDIYLRNEFPPPGKVKVSKVGSTPTDRYNQALAAFATALTGLQQAYEGLCKVTGDDQQPLVESWGVETRLVEPWRETLKRVEDELGFWGRTFTKNMKVRAPQPILEDNDEPEEIDPYADLVEGEDEEASREAAE